MNITNFTVNSHKNDARFALIAELQREFKASYERAVKLLDRLVAQ